MLELAFIQQCAPEMAPLTVNALVKTESSFNPWAIGVNSAQRLKRQPTSYPEALSIATTLMSLSENFDLGLAQINSRNLNFLNLSAQQVLDPCTNLRAMQTIFNNCLYRAQLKETDINMATAMAFSCYNTGNFSSGFKNGYVNKILDNHHFIINQAMSQQDRTNYYEQYSVPTNSEDLASFVDTHNQVQPRYTGQQQVSNLSTTNREKALHNLHSTTPINNIETVNLTNNTVKVHYSWDVFQDF